jgi:hypothetical protein
MKPRFFVVIKPWQTHDTKHETVVLDEDAVAKLGGEHVAVGDKAIIIKRRGGLECVAKKLMDSGAGFMIVPNADPSLKGMNEEYFTFLAKHRLSGAKIDVLDNNDDS